MSDAQTPDNAPTALVVAHPDDECLWLSAVVASADRIVFCFGDLFERPKMAAARRQAVAALQSSRAVNLETPESGAGFSVDWAHPRLSSAGIEIHDDAARARYEANFPKLVEGLRVALKGYVHIYTHNPWGEYGHAEHIQIYRAVATLQAELGYTIWFSNYVGAASWRLAQQIGAAPCWTERRTVRPDLVAARTLKRVYRRAGAWTWTPFHRWPAEENFYAQAPQSDLAMRHTLSGERLLDVAALRGWPRPWRDIGRRVG